MKKIFISLMVIALTAGLVGGGLFADFSDIETSRDNYFETGSLDLRVSDYLGNEYDDPNVPAFLEVSDAWPCCSKDIRFDLHNAGQGFQQVPTVYMHIKNLTCYPILTKDDECFTEPEWVAQFGGVVGEDQYGNPVEVVGIGLYGGWCELARHVDVAIFTSTRSITGPWVAVDLSQYDDDPEDGIIKVNELVCEQIELGDLPNCNTLYVMISFHLQDIDEDDIDIDNDGDGLIDEDPIDDIDNDGDGWIDEDPDESYFDETIPAEAKWDHWPTNALQKDGMEFDMAFELLQY